MTRNPNHRFYLFVTFLSIFLAESCSWSDPAGMVNPIQFILLRSIYGLYHVSVDPIIISRGWRRDRRKVYAFGSLFGLYEFPITKVYYEPGDLLYIHHVNIFNVLRIGFFRHALMSFTFPFYIGLFLFTDIDKEISKRRLKRIILFSSYFFFLFYHLNPITLNLILNPIIAFSIACLLIPKEKYKPEAFVFDSKKLIAILLILRSFYSVSRIRSWPRDVIAYAITIGFLILTLYMIFHTEFVESIAIGEPLEVSRRDCIIGLILFESLMPLAMLPNAIAWIMIVATILILTPLSIYLIYRTIKPKKNEAINAIERDRKSERNAYLRPTSVPMAAKVPTHGV